MTDCNKESKPSDLSRWVIDAESAAIADKNHTINVMKELIQAMALRAELVDQKRILNEAHRDVKDRICYMTEVLRDKGVEL